MKNFLYLCGGFQKEPLKPICGQNPLQRYKILLTYANIFVILPKKIKTMGKQVAPNYRGKGTSKTKFKKDGTPKHAGNYSAMTIMCAGIRSKDYKVRMIDGVLIVGIHTPLLSLLPAAVVEMAMTNGYFYEYHEKGVHTHNGVKYEAHRSLIRHERRYSLDFMNYEFVYREIIYTNCDEDVYQFPEY